MKELTKLLQKRFNEMCNTGTLYRSTVSGEELWEAWMKGFGNDPIFRSTESSVHNCNYCHSFFRQYGNLVALDNNLNLMTIWDIHTTLPEDNEYKNSVKEVYNLLAVSKIRDIFVETYSYLSNPRTPFETNPKRDQSVFKLGVEKNTKIYTQEDVDRWPLSPIKVNDVLTFEHLYLEIPKQFIEFGSDSKETKMARIRQYKEVFERGILEIPLEVLELVKDLEAQGSLLNGVSYMKSVQLAINCSKEYQTIPTDKRDFWFWDKTVKLGPAVTFRNTAIGTLMIDLAEGTKGIEESCKAFNFKVDPANYMKASAPITKKQIEEAKKFVEENGYAESLIRRCATIDDINASEILHTSQDAATTKTVISVFDTIKSSTPVKHKKSEFDKAPEIGIEDFLSQVIPGSTGLEVYLTGKHKNNFVTLLTSENKDSKPLFKWSNNFSWTYTGNLTGKSQIAQTVKSFGGCVDAPLRFSIMWNEHNEAETCDLDAHAYTPANEHIYYGSWQNRKSTKTKGMLDLDTITPGKKVAVENIFWDDLNNLVNGEYKFYINNFNSGNNRGAQAEIFANGETYHYVIPSKIIGNVDIATVVVKDHEIVEVKSSKYLTDSEEKVETVYGLETTEFHKVSLLCLSPNFWKDNVGNKHYFFMLSGAKAPGDIRSLHNEYLIPELYSHRKVMEVLGNQLKVKSESGQLSGLGFNATVRDEVIVRVSGDKGKKVYKIKF